jgi:Spy/CpxP family protein refolding chaperone
LPARFNTLTLVFAIAGGLLAGFAASTLAYRYRLLRVPGEPVLMRMTRELKLTTEQREQIATIMEEARLRVRGLRVAAMARRRRIFFDAFGRIRNVLTPEQQAKFDRDFGRPFLTQQRRMQSRFGGPEPGALAPPRAGLAQPPSVAPSVPSTSAPGTAPSPAAE